MSELTVRIHKTQFSSDDQLCLFETWYNGRFWIRETTYIYRLQLDDCDTPTTKET